MDQDEIVLFDRAVPPDELLALARQGRGAWSREWRKERLSNALHQSGGRLVLLVFSLLAAASAAQWLEPRAGGFAADLRRRLFRPVLGVLIAGGLLSFGLAGYSAHRGRQTDEAQFADAIRRTYGEMDAVWEKLAAFLYRTRDWAATQTNLTPEAWEEWMHSNRFPLEFSGAIGIGFAQQVQPDQLTDHEAEWAAKHRIDYRVHPSPNPARPSVTKELEGLPRLPVVLYTPRQLDNALWRANGTILGRDLLHLQPSERRTWAEPFRAGDAVARNEVTSSSREEIAPAGWYGQAIDGVRLYVPWTMRTRNAADRTPLKSHEWRGLFFASVDLRAQAQDFFAKNVPMLGYRIHTGEAGGERYDFLLDTGDFVEGTSDRPGAYIRKTFPLGFYYYRLFVEAWSTPAFEAQASRRLAWWLGAGGLSITILVAALLFVQVRARERQAQVLQALHEANTQLLAAYRERERLSRDLHDGSIQNFYALGLHLQRVETLLASAPAKAREELGESRAMLDHSIGELRQFILSARVEDPRQPTTASALTALIDRLRKTTNAAMRLHLAPEVESLEPRAGVQVLNVVRESVSNAIRHSAASIIEVRLETIQPPFNRGNPGEAPSQEAHPSRSWRLTISDNGRGFDVARLTGRGRGLRNFALRAAELGGRSRVESVAGQGTRILLEFPANIDASS